MVKTDRRLLLVMQRMLSGAALAALPCIVLAGPPFRTDDPEPTDTDHFEMYLYSEASQVRGSTDGTLAGVEINYGAAADLQLSIALPLAFNLSDHDLWHTRYGATELGAKYRLVHEHEDSWLPQLSFYPSIEIPGNGGPASTFLPLWLQKSLGGCEVFGGGGYRINPGPAHRNNSFAGIGSLCAVNEQLRLGGELFSETADSQGASTDTGFNLAVQKDFSLRWHLVASAGRGLRYINTTNQFSYYLGLELTI